MTLKLSVLAAALASSVLALAGCDRPDGKAQQSASPQSPAPQAAASASPADTGKPVDDARPSPEAAAPRPDSKTNQQPPVQGQIDSREGQQKRHLDGKG